MARKGRVVVMGAGPAGMAAALSIAQTEHDVVMLERYPAARPAGNILNLWPPPIKALGLLGVDTVDLGAPCQSEFRSASGRVRAVVHLPQEVIDQYGGGFIGMLRPQLYRRMLDFHPGGHTSHQHPGRLIRTGRGGGAPHLADGEVLEADLLVGADGIDSLVRRTLWGDAPKREHNLHIIGGFTFDDTLDVPAGPLRRIPHPHHSGQLDLNPTRRSGGIPMVGPLRSRRIHGVHRRSARDRDKDGGSVSRSRSLSWWPRPIRRSLQRWPIRDRPPLEKWSKGRATLVGDAAHPTSPYAAYGAGMSIEDGYFLGRRIAGVDISDPVALWPRSKHTRLPAKPHTAFQVDTAYRLGKIFHHIPAPVRPDQRPLLRPQRFPAEGDRRRHPWGNPQAARRDR